MDHAYDDILGMRRPVHTDDLFSRRHPKMTQLNRAKLFAPFAALNGFEEAIRAKEVPYVARHILDADESYELNRVLNRLHQATRTSKPARKNRIKARVEYFEICTDVNHDAYQRKGLYHTTAGIVRRVDPVNQILVIDNLAIPFDDIDNLNILEDIDHEK